jgi:hypothetical protein
MISSNSLISSCELPGSNLSNKSRWYRTHFWASKGTVASGLKSMSVASDIWIDLSETRIVVARCRRLGAGKNFKSPVQGEFK